MKVQVLGSGCSKCETTAKLIAEVAARKGKSVEIEKITDFAQIAAMGVMSTPAVALEGKVVHSGRIPLAAEIESWLDAA